MFEIIYRFDPTNLNTYKSPDTADEARRQLEAGNRQFAELTDPILGQVKSAPFVIESDSRAFAWDTSFGEAPRQAPFAAVLACSDARVPTELVFGSGCNQLFVVRVAGNILGNECLGSIRYAVQNFPKTLKLVVILAHARCGAVTEAVDVYIEPRRYITIATNHPVRSLADQILVAVRVGAMTMDLVYGPEVSRRPGYRDALIEASVVLNAAWSAYCMQEEFRIDRTDIGVAFGIYDLVSRHVRLPLSLPGALTEDEIGLFAPPKSAEEFRELSIRVCSGSLVAKHLAV
jgi:carbonic anhydrase